MSNKININALSEKVFSILNESESSRSSDKILLREYYKTYNNLEIPFESLDHPGSLIRVRRHLQKNNPSLRPSLKIQAERESREDRFKMIFSRNYEEK